MTSEEKTSLTSETQNKTGDKMTDIQVVPESMTKKSLFVFDPENPFRLTCIKIMKHPYFDGFILGCIAFNCVMLALTEPYENPVGYANVHWTPDGCTEDCSPVTMVMNDDTGEYEEVTCFQEVSKGKYEWASDEDEPGGYTRFQEMLEIYFTIIYTIEMSIKIVGLGFFQHKGSYLRDPWNWIDFIVVVSAWVSEASDSDGLGFLRTFRILRPLRTVNRFPEMKLLLATMFKSLVQLGSMGLLAAFFFVFFGIFGVQLFQGTTHGKCMVGEWRDNNPTFERDGETYWNKDALIDDIWSDMDGKPDKGTLWDYDPFFGDKVPPSGPDSRFLFDENDGDALCAMNDWQFWPESGAPIFVGETTEREFGRKCDPIDLKGVTIPRFCARYSWGAGSAKGFFNIPTYGTGNFDSFLEACATMWTSITLEGWVDIMYALGEGFGQAYLYFGESSGYWVQGYFILLVFFGNFFLLNLVLAVIEEQYNNSKQEQEDDEDDDDTAYAPAAGGEGNDSQQKSSIVESGAGSDKEGLIPQFYAVTEMAVFQNTVSLAILLNTITMGITFYGNDEAFIVDGVSYGMSDTMRSVLSIFETAFYVIFLLEFIIKMLGLGPRTYVKDVWNLFDGFIVISSTVDLILALTGVTVSWLSVLRVLRTFRLIRLFKLAFKSWPALRQVVQKVQQSFKTAQWLMALLLIMTFIFGLAGMKIFGGRFGHCTDEFARLGLCCTNGQMNMEYAGEEDFGWGQIVFRDLTPCTDNTLSKMGPHSEDPPRHHFDTIGWAMLTVFQVLTGENWNEVFYNAIKSMVLRSDEYEFNFGEWVDQFGTVLYFVCLTIIGQWLILGIFVAILLPDVDDDDDEDGEEETQGNVSTKVVPVDDNAVAEGADAAPKETGYVMAGKSLGCLAEDNPVRMAAFSAIKFKHFDNFILSVIVISTILLCYGDPAYSPQWLNIVNDIITYIFIIECGLKIVSLGLWFESKHAYLNDGFNKLDLFIVLISILEKIIPANAGGSSLTALKALRAMRGLRPLRAIKRYPGMMLVAQTIEESMPKMLAPVMVAIFAYTILAIFATHNFAGKMNSCNDGEKICRPGVKIESDHPDLYCNPMYWPQEIKDYYEGKEWFDMDEYKTRNFDVDDYDGVMTGVRGKGCLYEIDFPYGLGCHERSFGNLKISGETNLQCDPLVWEDDFEMVSAFASDKDWYTQYTNDYVDETDCSPDMDFPFGTRITDETEPIYHEHPNLECNPAEWPPVVKELFGDQAASLTASWDADTGTCEDYGENQFIRGMSQVNDVSCCAADVPFPYGLARATETGPACSGSFVIEDTDMCGYLPFTAFVELCQQSAYCGMLDDDELASLEQGTTTSICDKAFFMPRKWGPPQQNFDWVWSSFVTTFECSTGEMWPDIMYTTLDTVGVDQPMSYDHNLTVPALFFVFGANFLCAFIVLNLPISVVCDNYNDMKDKNGTGMLTESQQEWYEKQKTALRARPQMDENLRCPNNPLRAKAFRLVEHKGFEKMIIVCILLNTFTMMMNAFGDPYNYDDILSQINFVFGIVFTMESVLKIIAFDKNYLHAAPLTWNQFDFVLVLLFWIEIGDVPIGFKPTFLRVLRVFRVLRLFKVNKEIKKTMGTIIVSLPQLSNVGAVLALFVIVYAILGKELFWRVKMQENIHEYSNFRFFWTSFLLLLRAMTGESYNALMHDCRVQAPYCTASMLCYHDVFKYVECEGFYKDESDPASGFTDPSAIAFVVCDNNGCSVADGDEWVGSTEQDLAAEGLIVDGGNCGLPFAAQFYFMSYFLLLGLMFLGIIVAIVLDANAESAAAEGSPINEDHIDSFSKAWTKLDRTATGYIKVEQLPVLLRKVLWPLGLEHAPHNVSKGQQSLKIAKAIITFAKVQNNSQLYFNDVLSGLVSYALARDEQEGVNEEVRVENSDVAMRLLKEQRSRKLPRAITKQKILESEGELSIDMIIASVVIQSYFRR
jgi:hypothetical protein